MSKFSNLPFHTHEGCKTVSLARDAGNGEAWEARYCYNHDLKYKIQLVPDADTRPPAEKENAGVSPQGDVPAFDSSIARPADAGDEIPRGTSAELNDILQRAFAYGCEVGALNKDYKVSGVEYVPTGEIAALNRLITQSCHEAEHQGYMQACKDDPLKRTQRLANISKYYADKTDAIVGGLQQKGADDV